MIRKFFDALYGESLSVYPPGKKKGKATTPYVVVNEEKSEPSLTGRGIYTYLCATVVVPHENYGYLNETCKTVKDKLKNTPFRFLESDEDTCDEEGYKKQMTFKIFKRSDCN